MDEVKFNFDTVKVLLDTAKSEYDNEHNRTSVIDSKTSIALPIISAYCLALAQMNDYKAIFTMQINSFRDMLIPSCLFLTFTISLLLALISVIMMVKVIKMRDYHVRQFLRGKTIAVIVSKCVSVCFNHGNCFDKSPFSCTKNTIAP